MIQDVRLQGKLEQRFFTRIWLGKDAHTNEPVLAIPGKIVKARTVRRQVAPEKYNRQLMDPINIYPWNPTKRIVAAPSFMPLPRPPGTRSQDDTTAEGSTAKQARTAAGTTRERPGIEEPSPTRRRVNNITIKTTKGDTITTASSEDTAEQDNINQILKESII